MLPSSTSNRPFAFKLLSLLRLAALLGGIPASPFIASATRNTTGSSSSSQPHTGPTSKLYQSRATYHEDCGWMHSPHDVQDLSPLLKAALHIEDACIFNPGLLHLEEREGTMLMAFRVLWNLKGLPCITAKEPGGAWFDLWQDVRMGFAMAVVSRPASGSMRILSHRVVNETNLEDARLFRDQRGRIRILYNRVHPPVDIGHTAVHVAEVRVDPASYQISLADEQDLIYIHQTRHDKNWVPWEGTSLMTYTNYPSFAPHTVLHWKDYDKPDIQLGASAASPAPFLKKVYEDRGGWIRFSGGSPGIRLDKDRFVAVGHVVGDMSCFHRKIEVPLQGNGAARLLQQGQQSTGRTHGREVGGSGRRLHALQSRRRTSSEAGAEAETEVEAGAGAEAVAEAVASQPVSLIDHMCNSTINAPTNSYDWWFHHFRQPGHTLPRHHFSWDYFFFLYSWSALPPYEITHISHAFLPYDAEEHTGVVFPTGLQALRPGNDPQAPPALLLGYGKGDDRVMTLTLSPQAVQEYLQPVAGLDPKKYKFCAVGRDLPVVVVGP